MSSFEDNISKRDAALISKAYDVLKGNTVCPEISPWGNYDVISPWPGECAGIWNWDSAFHAMTVSRFDTALAQNCINCFVKFQLDNGMLPDVIYITGKIVDNFSKPPVMPWAVLTVFEAEKDFDFLEQNYNRLVANEKFWVGERCDGGLFFYSAQSNPEADNYLHPRYESGWDDSPRWDKPIVNMWPIDLNCFMVLFYRSMAKMAAYLGLDGDEWKEKEKKLSTLIEEKLFDDTQNTYVDRNRMDGSFSNVLSPASFMPLFVGIASESHACAMNALAADKNKFFPGMPTVSYDNPAFSRTYWRGQTWLNVAYFAAKGLLNYGYADTANSIKDFILQMAYDNLDKGIFENYDSVARVGRYNPSFSWSSAFIIEFILNWD